jgi:hypothetical protein
MEGSDFAERVGLATSRDESPKSAPMIADQGPGCRSHVASDGGGNRRPSSVYVLNLFAEGHIARGKGFTPVKHQAMLAEDLANLPQFLCQPDDIVLLTKRPSECFLNFLKRAGFPVPQFVEFSDGGTVPAGCLYQRKLGSLRPWAWGPDSIKLLDPLFARLPGAVQDASRYFNEKIARLYSKAWSASFLRQVLARCRGGQGGSFPGPRAQSLPEPAAAQPWLCSENEVGVVVDTLRGALRAIAAIRDRGHHRVVVKEVHGLAGHNAIRLWEPEILPTHRQWLANALGDGRQLVVERWLERELDFSVQLEMETDGLKLCGYTGLLNDRKGQFLANWAEADYSRCLPSRVAALLHSQGDIAAQLQRLYSEIFYLLEAELQRVGFVGPISIDAFVYRTPQGNCRLKPVVEMNPRYTMGRLTVELMKHALPGTCGLFRLVNRAQARAEGFADFSSCARSLGKRLPLRLEGKPGGKPGELAGEHAFAIRAENQVKIREGALCLNDPAQARVCLALFEVSPKLNLPCSLVSVLKPRANRSSK